MELHLCYHRQIVWFSDALLVICKLNNVLYKATDVFFIATLQEVDPLVAGPSAGTQLPHIKLIYATDLM